MRMYGLTDYLLVSENGARNFLVCQTFSSVMSVEVLSLFGEFRTSFSCVLSHTFKRRMLTSIVRYIGHGKNTDGYQSS